MASLTYLRNGYQGDLFCVCVITAAAFCCNNLESELELSKRDKEIQHRSPSDPLLLLDANQTNRKLSSKLSLEITILYSVPKPPPLALSQKQGTPFGLVSRLLFTPGKVPV